MFRLINDLFKAIRRRINRRLYQTRLKNREQFIRRQKRAIMAHTLKRENYLMPDYMAEVFAKHLYQTSEKDKFGKVVTQKG